MTVLLSQVLFIVSFASASTDMKLFSYLLLLLLPVLFSEVVVDFCGIDSMEIGFLDVSGEGESEREAKENAADDTEIDYFLYPCKLNITSLFNDVNYGNKLLSAYFLEIPSPPPERY